MMSFANPAPASGVNLAKPFDLSLSRDKATLPSGVALLSWSVHQRYQSKSQTALPKPHPKIPS